jgi:hypothetical protein
MIKKKRKGKKEKERRSKKWSDPAHMLQAAHVPLTLIALACLHLSPILHRCRNSLFDFRLRPSLCLFLPIPSTSAHLSLSFSMVEEEQRRWVLTVDKYHFLTVNIA